MATWHQLRNVAGLINLYQPDATEWKVVTDPPNGAASAMTFTLESEARAYAVRVGRATVVPPLDRKESVP